MKNVIIWGNHSSTQFPDARSATVTVDGKETPVYDAVKDDNWLKNDFVAVELSPDDDLHFLVSPFSI